MWSDASENEVAVWMIADGSLDLTKRNLLEWFQKRMMEGCDFGTLAVDPRERGRRDS